MARKNEAAQLALEGLIPSEISVRMQVSEPTVHQYLRTAVGEGTLRFSDIYFSWLEAKREVMAAASKEIKRGKWPNRDTLRKAGVTAGDVEFFRAINSRTVFAGDLYEHVAETEIAVHDMVRKTLVEHFGPGDRGFWRLGIPVSTRKACHARREEDDEPADDPFQYTTLIELAEVIVRNWKLFVSLLPKPYAGNRQKLLSDFARLNRIRNAVMHPVKRRRWSSDDFVFAKQFRQGFQQFRDS